MRIHVCFYLNDNEVININDVKAIVFLSDCVDVEYCDYGHYILMNYQYDRMEVDKI